VDHEVNFPLQDRVDSPRVSLLDVHLPLIAARLRVEFRVAGVPEVRIRDVGYADYVCMILSITDADVVILARVQDMTAIPTLYLDGRGLSVDHTKPFADQRHVHIRLFTYVRQRAREETPVHLSPVLQRTVPFSLFVGELGIDSVVRFYLYLHSLDDAQRIAVSAKHDGFHPDLG
jgi:hypothetical protein